MGLFTPLTLSEARRLGSAYGLDIAAVEPLAAGSVNSNFMLRTAGGETYFGRIYEEQDAAGALAELRLLDELAAAGVPVAAAVARPGEGLALGVGGKPFALYPWVRGDILCQARVRPAQTERVGQALAALHLATPRLGRLPEGRFRVQDLKSRLDRIERETAAYGDEVRRIRAGLDACVARRDPTLPEGLVHGDLFRDNVLWRDGELRALLDFESASRGPFVFDLAVCLLAWCYGSTFEPELAQAMLGGYHAVRPLTETERRALPVEGALAALRFATTRITDFSMRAAPGERPQRDYRRFLDRLSALEAGVLTPWIEALPRPEGPAAPRGAGASRAPERSE
jgi:homoserine kinase type II